ncbi:hypothetical protein SKAU_G00141500 [Synaphobranchus kaupii]|uniref:CREB3 regulatory factor n=1 Tax=Synaphobranchus kaupii TaxID=118154 RepID=A0A9Q1FSR0_SYNKA|nr:hypothetical protein SKAU_G00141500 [Synaphobranchus kaupii]
MPQPGLNGMEPVFGEAYGTHRSLWTSYPSAFSPQGSATEYDQGVVLMLGSPALPRKRPFELLSDLVDDGFIEDLHHEFWDISALDDLTRYSKGNAAGDLANSEGMLMARWSSREELTVPEPAPAHGSPPTNAGPDTGPGTETGPAGRELLSTPAAAADGEVRRREVAEAPRRGGGLPNAAGGRRHLPGPPPWSSAARSTTTPSRRSGTRPSSQGSDSETADTEEEDEEEDEEEGHEEGPEEGEEAGDCSSSEAECEPEPEPEPEPASQAEPCRRPQKRRCFWEYNHGHGHGHGHSQEAGLKKGGFRWPLSWSSNTLPSSLYRREGASGNGKKGRRKARKTDASDLTPNPQKLRNIGEQLTKLNAAINGMRHNKLASRACRLKKKAQHEANKIKLWGLNQEYDNLLGALLRIKDMIRQRVESSEVDNERRMTEKLEGMLKESAGPLVAGRTKDFVERILECSAAGQGQKGPQEQGQSV